VIFLWQDLVILLNTKKRKQCGQGNFLQNFEKNCHSLRKAKTFAGFEQISSFLVLKSPYLPDTF
jgi:hypothetical protein